MRLNPDAAVAFNGLTMEENRFLFRTRDPVAIASLVLKGLLNLSRDRAGGQAGDRTGSRQRDERQQSRRHRDCHVRQSPTGRRRCRVGSGHWWASLGRTAEGRKLVSLDAADIDADWLYLASLGPLENLDKLEQPIERAARETAEQSQRHGFRRLGVVAFGGAVVSDVKLVVEAMLEVSKDSRAKQRSSGLNPISSGSTCFMSNWRSDSRRTH